MRTATTLASLALTSLFLAPATALAQTYDLPWQSGHTLSLTQDCNDSCCHDHVNACSSGGIDQEYAWDVADGTNFVVTSPVDGTVVQVKMSSTTGYVGAHDYVNYIAIDAGNGSYFEMMHFQGHSLDPAVSCGEFVRAGQVLAHAGTTGNSTGVHLHFQREHLSSAGFTPTTYCGCGPRGEGCAANFRVWDWFGSTCAPYGTIPTSYADWPAASSCGNRRIHITADHTVAAANTITTIDDDAAHYHAAMGAPHADTVAGYHHGFHWASTVTGSSTVVMENRLAHAATPGIYRVWMFIPYSADASSRNERIQVIGRGEQTSGTLDVSQRGGGFHALSLATHDHYVRLAGSPGEAVVVGNGTGESGAKVTLDGVVLQRVGSVPAANPGAACTDSRACGGDLVCRGGRCAAGCETNPCACGQTCAPTGLCTAGGGGACDGGVVAVDAGATDDAGASDDVVSDDAAVDDDAVTDDDAGATDDDVVSVGDDAGATDDVAQADDAGHAMDAARGPDAGTTGMPSSGCGCRAAGGDARGGAAAIACALLGAAFASRRRRSR